MSTAGILLCALALDAALGEPDWLWKRAPHPAVLMGRLIGWADTRFNTAGLRRAKGALVVCALVFLAMSLGRIFGAFGPLVEILAAAILLAQKSLVQHVSAVSEGLRKSVADGRRAVAMIVGRDTNKMEQDAIARAAIESAAENFSDGVIAPAFWFLIGGLPGLFAYKIVNTADSMIGYRTPRHEQFGWAAARLDDFMNLLPARLTALIMALAYRLLDQWTNIVSEARRHRSPNAGWPEAAMARALDVALSGPRSYDGEMRDFPYVHPSGRLNIGPTEIDAATRALWVTWGCFCALVFALWLVGF